MKIFHVLTWFFFIYPSFVSAIDDSTQLSGLKILLQKTFEDTSRVNILLQMSQLEPTPILSLDDANKAIELEKPLNYKSRIARVYRKTGNIYFERFSHYENGLQYYFMALKICQEIGDSVGITSCLNNIGNIYSTKAKLSENESDFDKALQYHFNALEIRRHFKTPSYNVAASYLNIGYIYLNMRNYKKAIEYFHSSLTTYSVPLKPNEACDSNGVFLSFEGLSEAYLESCNYEKALEYINKCTHPVRDQKIDVERILGTIFFSLRNYETAIAHYKEALHLATSYKQKESEQQLNLLMAQLYEHMKNYKRANTFYTRYIGLKDSLMNLEISKNMSLMQSIYETEEKEKEIGSLKREKEIQDFRLEHQKLLLNSRNTQFILILLFIVILFGIFYYRNRAKQQELRYKAIIETEEKERMRIAKDLHDSLGQMLAAARLNVAQLEHVSGTDATFKRTFDNAITQIDDSCTEVRNISHNMMPIVLLKLGLVFAVQDFLEKMAQNKQIKTHFQATNLKERIESNIEIALYRVIQESVTNCIKHSNASEITLQLIRKKNNSIVFMIEDNGRGFDTADRDKFSGIGLKNIYSRVAYIKGEINIESQIGRGTLITIEIPAKNEYT